MQSPVPCRCAGREHESCTLGHHWVCVRDLWMWWEVFLNQQVLALKFPVFLQMGLFRDLPSAAAFARPRSVWHTWEPEQAPATACGLSWSRLHPFLYSEPLWVSDWASRTLQTRDSLRVPRFPSGGSSFARKFERASYFLLGKFVRIDALAEICSSGQAILYLYTDTEELEGAGRGSCREEGAELWILVVSTLGLSPDREPKGPESSACALTASPVSFLPTSIVFSWNSASCFPNYSTAILNPIVAWGSRS